LEPFIITVGLVQKGLAFRSASSIAVALRRGASSAAQSAARMTFSPGDRADAGLALVRGLDWARVCVQLRRMAAQAS